MHFARVLAVFVLFAFAGNAVCHAQIAQKIKVKHYKIGGKTAADLIKGMYQSGEKRGGQVLLASLATKIHHTLNFPPNSCRNGKMRFSARFLMKLPEPRHQRVLSKQTARTFNLFYDYLKKHEETHRRINVQCLSRLQSETDKVFAGVKSCDGLSAASKKVVSLRKASEKRCRAENEALDRRDAKTLHRTALYRAAKSEVKGIVRTPIPSSQLGFAYQPMQIQDRR